MWYIIFPQVKLIRPQSYSNTPHTTCTMKSILSLLFILINDVYSNPAVVNPRPQLSVSLIACDTFFLFDAPSLVLLVVLQWLYCKNG